MHRSEFVACCCCVVLPTTVGGVQCSLPQRKLCREIGWACATGVENRCLQGRVLSCHTCGRRLFLDCAEQCCLLFAHLCVGGWVFVNCRGHERKRQLRCTVRNAPKCHGRIHTDGVASKTNPCVRQALPRLLSATSSSHAKRNNDQLSTIN